MCVYILPSAHMEITNGSWQQHGWVTDRTQSRWHKLNVADVLYEPENTSANSWDDGLMGRWLW